MTSYAWRKTIGLILVLGLAPSAHAAPSLAVVGEIDYLLTMIDHSGCEFRRNGRWYGVTMAAAHLRYKYEVLVASGRINTAEDFIEKAATQSSLSGREYEVKCKGSVTVTSNQWLREALTRYRQEGMPGAAPGIERAISSQNANRPAQF